MSDHHVDAMLDFDHSVAAEEILKRHGLYISSAPKINHKPGNGYLDDVYYPFPIYPDNRFRNPYEEDKDIKFPPDPIKPEHSDEWKEMNDFQIIPEEIKSIKGLRNPIITTTKADQYNLIQGNNNPLYTGLTLQAVEKKAYDISIVKPYFENDERKNRLIIREIVTGHTYSIAFFDGWYYHIIRGKLIDICTFDKSYHKNRLKVKSMPYGSPVEEKLEDIKSRDSIEQNTMYLVMDCSTETTSSLMVSPVNQIIDIEHIDYIYDFTIYEGDIKVYWEDWVVEKAGTAALTEQYVYAPHGDYMPQTLYHEVIEHQLPKNYKEEE